MKLLSAFVPAALCALCALIASPPASAEMEDDLRLGLEAVTGMRTDYVYRGFDLAGTTMDFQLEGEVTLAQDLYLNLGGWFATATNDDFSELTGFADLRYDLNQRFTVGGSVSYHSYQETFFDDGFDLGGSLTYYATDEWDFKLGANRDFGAEGWYAHAESGWSYRINDDAYLGLSGGISWIDDYYSRSGLNDFYGRASFTYNVNSMISLTPFVGWSLEIEDGDGDELLGGLWFEVSF
jgi:hypothetical protein